ncbi:hypothetical protein CC77DRAFT_559887 [Alternaria alternata]|uniref:Uncharacterized protein n=1 Tax=Alternaria alternata TaxID=5599 RepID=A0A177D618_ALTAL|nr:hypothetical protein CC77DRAFT_559887 [Alternaria alternata]OAG14562.1 hypothetical protein CC77DRAFT_559887 [Alternaria alternata]
MSDERASSRKPSPTLYDCLGVRNEEFTGNLDNIHLTHEQNIPTPNHDIKREAPTPVEPSGTVNEDEAIRFLLQSLRPEQIVQYVKIHKVSKDAGNHAALDVISGVHTDDLLWRIYTVAHLMSTGPVPSFRPTFAVLHARTKLKNELSEKFDEKSVSSPQGARCARTTFTEEEPEPINTSGPADFSDTTGPPRPVRAHRRGCPGNHWNCKPAELKPRTYWTSFKKFREHYKIHMEDHRVDGHRWQCCLCDHDSFGGNGHDLAQHLWDAHFK